MNTREECSSGCVRSAGSATSTEGAVGVCGYRFVVLASCLRLAILGGCAGVPATARPPCWPAVFFLCWRLAGGCRVLLANLALRGRV